MSAPKRKKSVVARAKRDLGAKPSPLPARIEALEGVLRMLQKEAEKREATTATPEKERWVWVASVTASALEAK